MVAMSSADHRGLSDRGRRGGIPHSRTQSRGAGTDDERSRAPTDGDADLSATRQSTALIDFRICDGCAGQAWVEPPIGANSSPRGCHRPRKRTIQYSPEVRARCSASARSLTYGVLDAPHTRGMTAERWLELAPMGSSPRTTSYQLPRYKGTEAM